MQVKQLHFLFWYCDNFSDCRPYVLVGSAKRILRYLWQTHMTRGGVCLDHYTSSFCIVYRSSASISKSSVLMKILLQYPSGICDDISSLFVAKAMFLILPFCIFSRQEGVYANRWSGTSMSSCDYSNGVIRTKEFHNKNSVTFETGSYTWCRSFFSKLFFCVHIITLFKIRRL